MITAFEQPVPIREISRDVDNPGIFFGIKLECAVGDLMYLKLVRLSFVANSRCQWLKKVVTNRVC